MMKRPTTLDDYIELVEQAIFEVEELRFSVEFDEEFMEGALNFVDILEQQLTDLLTSLKEERYEFGNEDLPFMEFVKHQSNFLLPFKGLLNLINNTHRKGLDTVEE
ncbi:MAG TPA: general secretion pathway protein GspF [Gammaproteobacteria bacterium]|nr:general secretion pathway protein GspF [Gammaproteobacteria bacterium]